MSPIITATLSVGIIGLIIGVLLVLLGRKFAVEVNEYQAAVRDCLPGNNCGGCGYAGCDALAAAIANGEAPANACPVGGAPVAEKISHIMGVEISETEKTVAFVKCSGDCDHAVNRANYVGLSDCQAAVNAGLSPKGCADGCLGLGSCVSACPFDAIHVVNGVAHVNRSLCKSCAKCVAACPKHLIEIVPDSAQYAVKCANTDRGPVVKKVCSAGCLACKVCEKQCENDAIHVENNVAHIDYSKCTKCGKCAEKCKPQVISKRF
ncbi:MAG: RnfABCDGE type electron transport complex subunit B [Lachnospiraceae bacterium]|nr:RnfABCDGE type electron transport complex subunit B [Lachnospiraceae bacterium]